MIQKGKGGRIMAKNTTHTPGPKADRIRRKSETPPPLSEIGEYLNLEEAARFLRRPRLTVEKWARAGEIPAYKTGKRYLFRLDEIRAWIQDHAAHRRSSQGQVGPAVP